MNSALYRGRVVHRRHTPVEYAFSLGLWLLYLDLEELPGVFGRSRLWGAERAAPLAFRRSDHFGDPRRPLAECVRELLAERAGARARGPIRLLTQPRYFGFCFNPASLYYCFDEGGGALEHLVVEVTNTPWLERHCYVLDARSGSAGCVKAFHVSPFMAMEQEYRWAISAPGSALQLSVTSFAADERLFSAALALERVPISPRSLRAACARAPLQGPRIVGAIYMHALRLWLRGAPFHPHPARTA